MASLPTTTAIYITIILVSISSKHAGVFFSTECQGLYTVGVASFLAGIYILCFLFPVFWLIRKLNCFNWPLLTSLGSLSAMIYVAPEFASIPFMSHLVAAFLGAGFVGFIAASSLWVMWQEVTKIP